MYIFNSSLLLQDQARSRLYNYRQQYTFHISAGIFLKHLSKILLSLPGIPPYHIDFCIHVHSFLLSPVDRSAYCKPTFLPGVPAFCWKRKTGQGYFLQWCSGDRVLLPGRRIFLFELKYSSEWQFCFSIFVHPQNTRAFLSR